MLMVILAFGLDSVNYSKQIVIEILIQTSWMETSTNPYRMIITIVQTSDDYNLDYSANAEYSGLRQSWPLTK